MPSNKSSKRKHLGRKSPPFIPSAELRHVLTEEELKFIQFRESLSYMEEEKIEITREIQFELEKSHHFANNYNNL